MKKLLGIICVVLGMLSFSSALLAETNVSIWLDNSSGNGHSLMVRKVSETLVSNLKLLVDGKEKKFEYGVDIDITNWKNIIFTGTMSDDEFGYDNSYDFQIFGVDPESHTASTIVTMFNTAKGVTLDNGSGEVLGPVKADEGLTVEGLVKLINPDEPQMSLYIRP